MASKQDTDDQEEQSQWEFALLLEFALNERIASGNGTESHAWPSPVLQELGFVSSWDLQPDCCAGPLPASTVGCLGGFSSSSTCALTAVRPQERSPVMLLKVARQSRVSRLLVRMKLSSFHWLWSWVCVNPGLHTSLSHLSSVCLKVPSLSLSPVFFFVCFEVLFWSCRHLSMKRVL